jgi:aspartate aminotransferase
MKIFGKNKASQPAIQLEHHLHGVEIPANLRINDQIKQYRKKCAEMGCHRPYHHFAFGQSPFSPPDKIVEALKKNAHKHDYVPTAGIPELREMIARYYKQVFQVDCSPNQVVVSPGSKEMISMILAVLEGPVIIPSPSWVSYLPQAKILKKEVLSIRLSPDEDYKLTPGKLADTLSQNFSKQRILILNNPNNPTGAEYSKEELKDIAGVCQKYNVIVISDEIYARTSFDFENFTSMATIYPEKTIVTGGLSKDRSAGGYRMGVGIFPNNKELVEDVLKVAGSTYSCVATPIQYAAIIAYSQDTEIENYIDDCAQIHATIGRITSARLNKIAGVKATIPKGAFYLLVDFNEYSDKLKEIGFNTCADFCEQMVGVEHTALLPGNSLLLPEDDFSVRLSYVDYDGDEVLKAWRLEKPETDTDKNAFFEKYCPLVSQGIKNIERYFVQVAEGKMPVHV